MKILVFPKASNPYQELLYRELSKQTDFHYDYITFMMTRSTALNCVLFPLLLLYKRFQNYGIIHIHWLYEFRSMSGNGSLVQFFFSIYTPWILLVIKLLGYKLVYTIHDSLTHDHQFWFERGITATIVRLSNALICLSEATMSELKSLRIPIPQQKITILPHGSYSSWYSNSISTTKARQWLNLPQKTFVLLFFGIIRPYKGISHLLNVLKTILPQHNLVFVLAGACYDGDIEQEITNFSRAHKTKTKITLNHIPDHEVQNYFNACDCAVFPFQEITNSGSVFLAASFKKPFIAPFTGSLVNFPSDAGFFYDPADPNGLATAIETAIQMKSELFNYGLRGYDYVHSTNWSVIAKKTLKLYQRL